jgi:hypothetical protein
MGIALVKGDEGLHAPGGEINWNESRYIDFWDPAHRVGGWLRIGVRPNAGYSELSTCVYLPDGRVAFGFDRADIDGNTLVVTGRTGTQTWKVVEPWHATSVRFRGDLSVFDDPWSLTDPKAAFAAAPNAPVELDLTCATEGLGAVMGQDQDQHLMIFLPGQADFHYQHLTRVTGTIRVGDELHDVDGRGGKDHSWGPRNWHAKIYLRWLICGIDDDNGFMLVRSVGPAAERRSGFVWVDREFRVVDGFELVSHYADAPWHQLERADVTVRAGDVEWAATGVPQSSLPARHRQPGPDGSQAVLRLVKYPSEWTFTDGRTATGHCEYHDLLADGVPVGLHE